MSNKSFTSCFSEISIKDIIESFFKQKFNNKKIKIEGRANKDDSAEVFIEDEFIGVVFEDNEDGDMCYQFNMTILTEDLDD